LELLQHVVATLRFPGRGEDPVNFSEDPTVTITRHSDGSVLVADAATAKVEGEENDIDHYTVDLTGAQLAEVDLLIAVWTDGESSYTTYREVVGAFACPLASIEEKYDEGGKTAEEYAEARAIATRDIESACGVAFRPRYGKELLDGSRSQELLLRQPRLLRLLRVAIDGEDLSEEEVGELILDPAGLLVRTGGWPRGRSNIEVVYVHGHEGPSPARLPVRDLAAYLLTESPTDMHGRATSMSQGDATYTLVTPGVRGASFPVPSVNAFVEDNRYVSVG
jgi:hypothetical protein